MFTDFNLPMDDADNLVLAIRTGGFLSEGHRLRTLKKGLPAHSLAPGARYELALAYARCLLPEEAASAIEQLPSLSKARRIEAAAALCLSYAERAMFNDACRELRALEEDEILWTADQTEFDRQAVVFHTTLGVVYAAALAVVPRLPFTENFHTLASAHHSSTYSAPLSKQVLELLAATVARLRKDVDREKWRRYDLHAHLFRCECAVYAMAGSTEIKGLSLSIPYLAKRLHGLQREHARDLRRDGAAGPQSAAACGADYISSILRSFLWAIVIKPGKYQAATLENIKYRLEHAQRHIPGFQPSVADLEPALLAALPTAVWSKAHTGNFKDNAAFMLADEFLCNPPRATTSGVVAQLMAMARRAMTAGAADYRLIPLCVLLAVTQGKANLATQLANAALEAPLHAIQPGSLALAHAKSPAYYERMFQVLATFKPGADIAVAQLRAQLQSQGGRPASTDRMAAGLLYCCAKARSEAVAHDVVSALKESQGHAPSARIMELYMRACVRSGLLSKALPLLRHLSYGGATAQVGEPSFLLLIDYMADQRESAVGAEHAFDAWLQAMDYRGRATATLVDRWHAVGMCKEARGTKSMFLPEAHGSVAQALEGTKVARQPSGSRSSRHFLRNWEFHMVVSLICAYITSGQRQRAASWERWILDAIRAGELQMKPEFVFRAARAMQRHLEIGTWEHIQPCLDLIVAIDGNIGKGKLADRLYVQCLQPAYRAFVAALCGDHDRQLAARIREYLEQHNATHMLRLISGEA
ncbi:hypothetical protein LPJ61_003113 [Coemansia biformis]|uniref:Uncharacterized protein n=1 Tax=Coemansia biformis TaxID=1286918 RepID=A0A9W8CY09_9FUNG|nr:hypothetical protein LPJ61_003113 [Coemansia biformis]